MTSVTESVSPESSSESNADGAGETVVSLADVRFAWNSGSAIVIDIHCLNISRGERIFVRGPSGSGKSTLLSLLGGMVTPQHGMVRVLGQDLSALIHVLPVVASVDVVASKEEGVMVRVGFG